MPARLAGLVIAFNTDLDFSLGPLVDRESNGVPQAAVRGICRRLGRVARPNVTQLRGLVLMFTEVAIFEPARGAMRTVSYIGPVCVPPVAGSN